VKSVRPAAELIEDLCVGFEEAKKQLLSCF
jgi:hypothetical protein